MTPLLEMALLALPAHFLQTVLHEGAHAVAVLLRGGRVTRFRPWPRFADGRFRFGATIWTATGGNAFLLYAAPRLVNLLQLALLWWLPTGPVVFVARIAAMVDYSYNTVGIAAENHSNDAWRCVESLQAPWRRAWGWATFAGLVAAWLLAFGQGVP